MRRAPYCLTWLKCFLLGASRFETATCLAVNCPSLPSLVRNLRYVRAKRSLIQEFSTFDGTQPPFVSRKLLIRETQQVLPRGLRLAVLVHSLVNFTCNFKCLKTKPIWKRNLEAVNIRIGRPVTCY